MRNEQDIMEAFFNQFDPIKGEIHDLESKLEKNRAECDGFEKELKEKKEIEVLLRGLRTAKTQRDPGKYSVACYFVQRIFEDDIVKSEKPALVKECVACKDKHPVLMSYQQTYDSPEGDTWEKNAFMICPKTFTMTVYKTVTRDGRF